jgi:hypothetical protein
MLLAGCASLLVTAGLAIYDFREKKKREKESEESSDKKRGCQSIRILLTGGP